MFEDLLNIFCKDKAKVQPDSRDVQVAGAQAGGGGPCGGQVRGGGTQRPGGCIGGTAAHTDPRWQRRVWPVPGGSGQRGACKCLGREG